MIIPKLTILGHGSQGRAWAFSAKYFKAPYQVLLRDNSPSLELSTKLHPTWEFSSLPGGLGSIEALALLIPDHEHSKALELLAPQLKKGTIILYPHGLSLITESLHLKWPHLEHVLLAPKAIASEITANTLNNTPVPAVIGLDLSKESLRPLITKLATSIGLDVLVSATVSQEVHADLLSEQTLHCSYLPFAAASSFKKLCEEGIPEELAYLECWYELKLIAKAMVDLGPLEFFKMVSPTALIGGLKGASEFELIKGPKGLESRESLSAQKAIEKLSKDIKSGEFFQEIGHLDISSLREFTTKWWEEHPLTSIHQKMALGPRGVQSDKKTHD